MHERAKRRKKYKRTKTFLNKPNERRIKTNNKKKKKREESKKEHTKIKKSWRTSKKKNYINERKVEKRKNDKRELQESHTWLNTYIKKRGFKEKQSGIGHERERQEVIIEWEPRLLSIRTDLFTHPFIYYSNYPHAWVQNLQLSRQFHSQNTFLWFSRSDGAVFILQARLSALDDNHYKLLCDTNESVCALWYRLIFWSFRVLSSTNRDFSPNISAKVRSVTPTFQVR